MNHGTRWTYDRYGCRCGLCVTGMRDFWARRRIRAARAAAARRATAAAYVDEIAVERACRGDRSITLTGPEVAAAFAYLDRHGHSLRQIAAVLGVSDRCVSRWRAGEVQIPHSRPGRKVA